jgi:hypothetical protein
LEKDATGVCTISKLFPHNLTKSHKRLDFTRFLKIIRKNPENSLDSGGEGVIYIV